MIFQSEKQRADIRHYGGGPAQFRARESSPRQIKHKSNTISDVGEEA
jgi:hypothetical protein